MLYPQIDSELKVILGGGPAVIHAEILRMERWTDDALNQGVIDQETAWDSYFGLLHACDLQGFWADRKRILSKIDTNVYNPLLSRDPAVASIARTRYKGNTARRN